jgi:hypothetical protein
MRAETGSAKKSVFVAFCACNFGRRLGMSKSHRRNLSESAAPFGVRRDLNSNPQFLGVTLVNTTDETPTKSPRPKYEPADIVWGAAGIAQVLA